MNSADLVISKFGGPAALAKIIGKGASTISYWRKTGAIPTKWQKTLLSYAEAKGIDLAASDFLMAQISPQDDLNPAEEDIPTFPKATHWGDLGIGDAVLPAYVLEDGSRVFSLKGVVVGLIGTEGGQLAEYLKVKALRDFLPPDLKPAEDGSIQALIRFDTGNGEGAFRYAMGFPVERFMDLCSAYSDALAASRGEA